MLRRLVGPLSCCWLRSPGARAQESASSAIVGLVTDTTQAALPGATVTVTQVGTSAQRVVVTDGEGRFSVPGLRPATYTVRGRAFRASHRPKSSSSTLRNGETVRPTLTLAVGNVAEQITVTGESPLLQTHQRVRRSGHFGKDDRGSAAERPRRAVAHRAVRRRHAASRSIAARSSAPPAAAATSS